MSGGIGGNLLGEFLRARREVVTPAEVGIPDSGRRRVPGLRREELAMLAGISIDYYRRLERGICQHPSDQILDALASVLRLDGESKRYLYDLVRPEPDRESDSSRPHGDKLSPIVLEMLNQLHGQPAIVHNQYLDVLAANDLARGLHPSYSPGQNAVHNVFLNERARAAYADPDATAARLVGDLRAKVGVPHPDDERLQALVGELAVQSDAFRQLWARQDVKERAGGSTGFRHPLAGEFRLNFESLNTLSAPGHWLVVFHAPTTRDADALTRISEQLLTDLDAGDDVDGIQRWRPKKRVESAQQAPRR